MKIKKQPSASAPQAWSVAELGAFYTEHNFELKAHANRILKDSVAACKPLWMEVKGEFNTRGGMHSIIEVRFKRISKSSGKR